MEDFVRGIFEIPFNLCSNETTPFNHSSRKSDTRRIIFLEKDVPTFLYHFEFIRKKEFSWSFVLNNMLGMRI